MSDNTQVNLGAGGDVIRDIDRSGVKTQVVQLDAGGTGAESLVSSTNPMPISVNAAGFIFSTANSSSAQLAPGATFSGTIETATSQPAISINITTDQPVTLTLYQYIDIAGTYAVKPRIWNIDANAGISFSMPINGNYVKMTAQNAGIVTTTKFSLDVAYGSIDAADQAGNRPVAIFGSNNIPGVDLIEAVIRGDLSLSTQVSNSPRVDTNNAQILSDCPGQTRVLASTTGQQFIIDTQGYSSLCITMGTMQASLGGVNDPAGIWAAIQGMSVAGGVTTTGSLLANTSYIVPCMTRYIRLTVTVVGWATYVLRNLPAQLSSMGAAAPVNLSVIGGSASVAVAGQLALSATASSNGCTIGTPIIMPATPAATTVKATAGRLMFVSIANSSATGLWLKAWNQAAAPTIGTTSVNALNIYCPPSGVTTLPINDLGIYFSLGIQLAVTGGISLTDATAITASTCTLNYSFI
jgi:hypothetical protein